jgi:hypothetical protein
MNFTRRRRRQSASRASTGASFAVAAQTIDSIKPLKC